MKKNVSNIDSYIRYSMALILVVLAIVYAGWFWLLLIPAAIMVVTGYRQVCHIYSIFGMSTCKLGDKK